jgi:2-methylisocitrate lyase-like PEP mutase family enzyme
VISAKIYEQEGFEAVGTTSAGIAATLGFPDGQRIGAGATAEIVSRIVHRVSVPVSADIEAGYSSSPEGVADSARLVLESGAVGINLEDSYGGCGANPETSLSEVEAQMERIQAVREMTESAGVPLFINARTDVFLVASIPSSSQVDEAIRRGNMYLTAGADCVFVPDLGDLTCASISTLASELDGPLNIIAGKNTPPVPQLAAMGVARLSFGPRPMRAALSFLAEMAREWTEQGTYRKMMGGGLTYDQVNAWFGDPSTPRSSHQEGSRPS